MEKGLHIETVQRFIENKEAGDLIECLETLEPQSRIIGEGKNAEVLGLDEGKFRGVCMKKIKKNPELKCNDLDTEVDYQNRVHELGIKTPLTFAHIKIKKDDGTEEQMILMQRIIGCTIDDVVNGDYQLPENYNHKIFFEKLKGYIQKMHEANIHHRDLHEKNVMIDENGEPAIIDFGTACTAFSGDEFPYSEQVLIYNKVSGRYEMAHGYFKDDNRMLQQLELRLRKFAQNIGAY